MNEAVIRCDGISILVLQNTVQLQKLKKLWRYKAPKDAAVPKKVKYVVGSAVMLKKVKHVVATKKTANSW